MPRKTALSIKAAAWLGLSATISLAMGSAAQAQDASTCDAVGADYNYVLATQVIGGPYKFTKESSLTEQAHELKGLGSNVLKLTLAQGAAERYGAADAAARAQTTLQYIQQAPDIQRALDMDFKYTQAWVHSFTGGNWRDGVGAREAKAYYNEMYELSAWLLTRYAGTGKVIMLGNWEGDWLLNGGPGRKATPPMEAVQGMIDWLNIRQKAVDDAKAAIGAQGVELYHYVEVNRVRTAMEGNRSIAKSVIPKTNVDLVSYSSYEAIKMSPKPDLESIRQPLTEIFDYLEGQLKPKPDLPFKRRVFLGEYGYHADKTKPLTVKQQYLKSRYVMQVAIELDIPFALIWQMYNNEYTKNGTSKEMSLIDESGQKRALYFLHQHYLAKMNAFVVETCQQTGQAPTAEAFKARALQVLENATFKKMQAKVQ
jgi:hypothetical protein